MSKVIVTETRYKNMTFNLVKTVGDLQMYFSEDGADAIIVNRYGGEVLFEIKGTYSQDSAYLEDGDLNN